MTKEETGNGPNVLSQYQDDKLARSILSLPAKPHDLIQQRDTNPQEPPKTFKLRKASSVQRRTQAYQLIQRKFSLGKDTVNDLNLEENPNRITLLLDFKDNFVGTITLVFDSPLGLDADKTYKAELDVLRADGRKLAEMTNFARSGGPNNKRVLASFAHLAYIYARRIHSCTDFVVEVKARHSRYYENMLGFQRRGSEKECSWVNEKVVLLCLDLDHMGKQIEKFGGLLTPPLDKKSLYPYFFSKQDENGIAARLSQESK